MPPDQTTPPAPPTSAPPAPDAPPTGDARPPWERTGEPFDPDRAWTLIQRLRAELADAKAAPPAPPTGADPTPPATAPAGTDPEPDDEVARLRADLVRERVGRQFSLDDALTELLGTGDEAAITARAQLLAELRAERFATRTPGVARRPVERLRGGGHPTAPAEETDPAKLAARVRRHR